MRIKNLFFVGLIVFGLGFLVTAKLVGQVHQIETINLTAKNHSYLFGHMQEENTFNLMIEIQNKVESLPPTEPFYLVINTPGGLANTGNTFIDFLKGLNREITTVTISAHSMGFQIVQELGERLITENGLLSNHRYIVPSMPPGPSDIAQQMLDLANSRFDVMYRRIAKRMGVSIEAYREKVRNDDYMKWGQEAVEDGAADRVVRVHCDLELLLSGTCPMTRRIP